MQLNDIWGYGQLFGFSGLDGVTHYYYDFIGMLTAKKGGIRFELREPMTVQFPIDESTEFAAVTGDLIESRDGKFAAVFRDADTVVGYTPDIPTVCAAVQPAYQKFRGVDVYSIANDHIAVATRPHGDGYKFALHHSNNDGLARVGATCALDTDIEALKEKRYGYYRALPPCKDERYEKLYYKTLSVNKVNVYAPEGNIPCRWTTPDRVPHHHLWLWDSVFHALAMVRYDPAMAKDAVRAVLSQIHADGFAPHMMTPSDCSDVTQPQVLAWGVWEVYKATGDKAFLKESAPVLSRYLQWDMQNRDRNGNGLLEWKIDPEYPECRSGESGLDNSPRFDADEEMDAIDFSVFMAQDAYYLGKIFAELGDKDVAKEWNGVYERIKGKINELLWCQEDGAYYDRTFGGRLTRVLTPSSFFPMMAGIPDKAQAAAMVRLLADTGELWTANPVATVSQKHPAYGNDMWRGGVWLNLNYFIVLGLRRYGYTDLAKVLRDKTLAMADEWYKKTGTVFEFYDPENKTAPWLCERKGRGENPPDWRKHVHAITDYNWSACFTQLFIQDVYYGEE